MNAVSSQISFQTRRAFKSTAPDLLSGDGIRLMLKIQDVASIDKLAGSYPHVVNKLADLWKRPVHADRYFDELMHDKRGGRMGFPLGVMIEISDLYTYYRRAVFPVRQDVWSDA
jgi:hypothetical protein